MRPPKDIKARRQTHAYQSSLSARGDVVIFVNLFPETFLAERRVIGQDRVRGVRN